MSLDDRIYFESEVAQSCLTVCNTMDCSLPGFSIHRMDFPGKITRVGCHFFFQGILPTQGSNPGLPHCRQMLYCLSHQGISFESCFFYTFFNNLSLGTSLAVQWLRLHASNSGGRRSIPG